MRRPPMLVPALALLSALALAACGGSGSPSTTTSTTTSTAPHSPSGGVPAVTNATDLKVEPVPAAGSPPPPTTLVTKDLVVGTGAEATPSSTVQVQYVGASYDTGKVFDSSWQRGQPATFPLNGVIPGFSDAIAGMKVGGRREVVIPPALGYGAQGSPPAVLPNETLVFVIDLLAVQ